jgi:DNA polymerase-3 subunit epsilon
VARGPLPRRVALGLLAAGGGALGLAFVAAAAGDGPDPLVLALGAGTVGAVAILGSILRGHFEELERVRSQAVALAGAGGDPPPGWAAPGGDEAGRVAAAVGQLVAREREAAAAGEARLSAIVAGLDVGVLAATPTGLVALANGAAYAALGDADGSTARVGTSLFDAVHREALDAALAEAAAAGRPVRAELRAVRGDARLPARVAALPGGAGAVILFPDPPEAYARAFAHAPELLDRPPAPPALSDDLPLAELPACVLDAETTGLDPRSDRMVSLGAVRMHGTRVYRAETLDLLVDPGVPIPARSRAVHGIGDAMVAGAPPAADALARLSAFAAGCVAVGHNVGFDLALAEAEAARAGVAWERPPALDTLQLAAALEPSRTALDLEDLAEAYGVSITGRHTALGDSLVTAALFSRMIPLLAERGVTTLGAARALAARQTRVLRAQAEAGW